MSGRNGALFDAARWARVQDLFDLCLSLPPHERESALLRECGGDGEVLARVGALLVAEGGASEDLARVIGHASAELIHAVPPAAGARVGPYELVRELGKGGMGTVFLAQRVDDELDQRVAVKFVHGLVNESVIRRFRAERQILSGLHHTNIAAFIDVGVTEHNCPYLVMEYVEGEGLLEYCNAHRLDLKERLTLFVSICDAVDYAHSKGIVHRDLKPDNLLVDAAGEPKLLDFGIAKLVTDDSNRVQTATGRLAMTPAYASPEQVNGQPVTPATDVYALGAVLYDLASGCRPFDLEGKPLAAVARIIADQPAPAPAARLKSLSSSEQALRAENRSSTASQLRRALTGPLETLILSALEKQPERRPPSAAALAAYLRDVVAGKRRWRYLVAPLRRISAAAALIVLVLMLGFLALRSGPEFMLAEPQVPPAPFVPLPNTVAILPLRALGGDDAQWIGAGIADTIWNSLAISQQLSVISPGAVEPGAGDGNLAAIARQLNVALLVDGSVNWAGATTHVQLRLIDTVASKTLWSDRFEIDPATALAAQDDVARAAVDQVHRQLGTGEAAAIQAAGTDNVHAYSLYLQGVQHIRDYNGELAIEPLQAAIELDPGFAQAYVELANAYDTMVSGSSDSGANNLSVQEYRDLVGPLVQKALELNDRLPEAHVVYGLYRSRVFDDVEAELTSMHRAIELAPSYSTPYRWLGFSEVAIRGDLDQGWRYFETALRLDPTYALNAVFVGEARARAGQVEDGRALMVNAMKSSPSDLVAGNLQHLGWEFGPLADAVKWALVADTYGVTAPWNYGYASLAWTRVGDLDKAAEWIAAAGVPAEGNRVLREARDRLALRRGDFEALRESGSDYYQIVAALLSGERSERAERLLIDPPGMAPGYFPALEIFRIAYALRYAAERGLAGSEALARVGDDVRRRLEQSALFWPTLNYAFAALAAALDRPDEALALLEKSVAQGWYDGWYSDLDPNFGAIRDTADFRALRDVMEVRLRSEHEKLLQLSAVVPQTR